MSRTQKVVLAMAVLSTTIGAAAQVVRSGDSPQGRPSNAPEFLREGRCYRIAFTIDSAPAYKVLEIVDGGWIRAEVDAGSGQAQRQAFWANTAQMVTVREQRCSE